MKRKELAEMIFKMMPALNRKFFKKLPHFNFPKQQLQMLHTVSNHSDESMKFYCEKLFISKPNLSKLVDGMIEEGLIERHHDMEDRRVIRIRMTPKGDEILTSHYKMMIGKVSKMFEVISDEDVDQLNYHFKEIHKILDKIN